MPFFLVAAGLCIAWIAISFRLRRMKREFWLNAGRWDRIQSAGMVSVAVAGGIAILLVSMLRSSSNFGVRDGALTLLIFVLIADLWFTSFAVRWHSFRKQRTRFEALVAANSAAGADGVEPDSAD